MYVESNFVIEIARQQEDSASAAALLRLAEASSIDLAFPTFSLCEPFSTLTYYGSERNRFVDSMNRQLRELERLLPHRSLVAVLQPVAQALLAIKRQEMDLLEATVESMLTSGRSIGLTSRVFRQARQFETRYDLSPQDAIVYASVVSDLGRRRRGEAKCFVSRNPKDFDDPSITGHLSSFGCRYIATFADALRYVRNHVRSIKVATPQRRQSAGGRKRRQPKRDR